MNLIEIFLILFFHWLFDFVFQTNNQAQGKSKSWGWLLEHTFIYSICWIIPIAVMLDAFSNNAILCWSFATITFIAHTITDYYTSRVNSQLWEQKKVHQFFVSIGFDQLLHYIQLFTTYYYLKTL